MAATIRSTKLLNNLVNTAQLVVLPYMHKVLGSTPSTFPKYIVLMLINSKSTLELA